MKTPRDILLSKHQTVMPKLDATRQKVVAKLVEPSPLPSPIGWERQNIEQAREDDYRGGLGRVLYLAGKVWEELVLPCRRIWTGLAVIWALILIINFAQRDNLNSVTGQPANPEQIVISPQTQQQRLSKVLADRIPSNEADRPKNYTPKPKTENSILVVL